MTTVRFITDGVATLGTSEGPVVIAYKRGEIVELDDNLAAVFIAGGSALKEATPERAVKPRGERAVRATSRKDSDR